MVALENDDKQQAPAEKTLDLEAAKPASVESSEKAPFNSTTPTEKPEAPGAKVGLSLTQFWIVMVGLNIGMLLTALDFNIVAPAAPTISSQFNEFTNSAWLGSGFLISFAVVQGAGAGGIYGLVNVIITDLVPLKDVGNYLATTALVWAVADVLGPLLGGIFTQYASWRWCFYINLCISPISLIVTIIYLRIPTPKVALSERLKNLDYVGFLTLPGATTCLLLALQWGGITYPWSDGRVIGCFVGAAVLSAIFIFNIFKVAKDPLLPAYFFTNRTILAINAAEFCFGANLVGMMYYVPQFFQIVFGDSALISGIGLIPMMVGLLIGNPIAAQITSRKGMSKINVIWGGLIMVLMCGLITRWNMNTSRAEAVVLLVFLGIGQGAVFSGLLLTAQAAVPPPEIGVATGLVIFAQTVGDIFGVAVFANLYINKLHPALVRISGLTSDDIQNISQDIHAIRKEFAGQTQISVIDAHAKALQYALTDNNNCGTCGNKCDAGKSCCGGTCKALTDNDNCGTCGNKCGVGKSCCGGTCKALTDNDNCGTCGNKCDTGKSCCGGTCKALTDNNNCGTCGNKCDAGKSCCGGICKALTDNDNCGRCGNKCGYGETCCGGTCKALTDNDNCGRCGNKCGYGETCCGGSCKKVSEFWSDENNCGRCGNKCDYGETCCGGSCKKSSDFWSDEKNCGRCGNKCDHGKTCCGGSCKKWSDFSTDEKNCGRCGNKCGAGEICCGGSCKKPLTDQNNCGSCDKKCGYGETCCGGSCTKISTFWTDQNNCGRCGNKCGAGETCCGGSCTKTSTFWTDEKNCGRCGNKCGAGETCCGGTCKKTSTFWTDENNCGRCGNKCDNGKKCCGGSCINVWGDDKNCGGCGKKCDYGKKCCSGSCTNVSNDIKNCGDCGKKEDRIAAPVPLMVLECHYDVSSTLAT
ncbi:Efflux pump dotC [Drechslerella dactyloides]|uniref:Efflux pump dotC n=1 Tax=Drechslerella dactyloides TaxID=74499 RepID=A0AAD6J7G9_DREDA|nr:Efflux pump dotC [Drechslerella dactyloides]